MKRKRHLTLGAVLILLILLGGPAFTHHMIDFPVYHIAGRSLLSGSSDLYSPRFAMGELMDYRYPPFFLIAFIPLWRLPYSTAAYIWYLISILEISLCVLVLYKTLDRKALSHGDGNQRWRQWIWILTVLAVGQYFVMILHYGNAHLLAIALLFGSFYFATRREEGLAAIFMSLSITIKLTPLLILPYFALRRRWKFSALVGLLIFAINLLPMFYFGFGKNLQLLKTWYHNVIVNQQFHEINGPINLSLKGELQRYLTEVDYSKRLDGDMSYPAVNVAILSTQQVDHLWMVLAALFLILSFWLVYWTASPRTTHHGEASSSPPGEKDLDPLELGIMVCLMLLVAPLTSKIYFIALLWPVACLGHVATLNLGLSSRVSRLALLFIAVANFVLPLLPGRLIQRQLLVVGVDFYITLIVLATLAYVLISERRSASITI